MTRPRVCLATFSYPPEPGGVGRSAERLVGYLWSAGYDIEVFTPRRDALFGLVVPPPRPEPVPVHRVRHDGTPAGIVRAITGAVTEADRQRPFDLFHGFFLPMATALLPVAAGRRPLVASVRGDDAVGWLEGPRARWALPALAGATWVTSVSHDLLARAVEASSRRGPTCVIANGVGKPAVSWRLEASRPGRVGTVGVFQPKKAIPELVEAYAAIPRRLRTGLLLVGHPVDRPEARRIEDAIRRAGVGDEVAITGWCDDAAIARHLASLRVFVQCSRHDGFPNALLEAAAAGVPLVATAVGALAGRGAPDLRVPPDDGPALTRSLTRVLADPALASTLSEAAAAWAARHSTRAEAASWQALYRQLAATSSDRTGI